MKSIEVMEQKAPLEQMIEKSDTPDAARVYKLIALEFGLNYY